METSIIIAFCFLISSIACEDDAKSGRFSIFQIIKFKNEPCVGNNRNGTCFTSAECDDAGGTEAGSCADGFGVCCTVTLVNGASTSLNQSYIVQSASTTLTAGPMQYTICPCSDDVCRIRFDFTQFTLNGPGEGPTGGLAEAGVANADVTAGSAIGDCLTDTFSITSASGGTPVICGTNGGQHMYIDTDGNSCSTVNFGISGGATSRNWDIMVTQYKCGEESGGPPGCLQWHMAPQGKIRSFNFPDQAQGVAVMDTVTHLSNQQYNICIRKNAASNHICYTPCTLLLDAALVNANMGSSFGVSKGPDAAAKSGVSGTATSACITDYLEIIGGTTKANAILGTTAGAETGVATRYCGRSLDQVDNLVTDNAVANPLCTASLPFRVGVQFDANEDTSVAAAAKTDETFKRPGGIMGFALCYDTTA